VRVDAYINSCEDCDFMFMIGRSIDPGDERLNLEYQTALLKDKDYRSPDVHARNPF
jgi:hypothetical protein